MADTPLPQNMVNVLSRMLPPRTEEVTGEEAVPTALQRDYTNPDTKETVTIFSTTGDFRSQEAFDQAMAQYEASGEKRQAPQGFATALPGSAAHKARTGFNTVSRAVREFLPQAGERLAQTIAPTGFSAAGERYGIVPPGTTESINRAAQSFGAAEGTSIGEQVKTPGAAGMTAAQIATTPFLGPVTKAGRAGKAVMSLRAPLGNAVMQGLVGGTFANMAEMATGNTPRLREAAASFEIAGASGGIQSILSGIIGRYVTSPVRQREVAEGVLGEIGKKYPTMVNNPKILDSYASAPENLKRITGYASDAIRGTVDDLTDEFMVSLGQMGKMNLTVGQQHTMRAQARSLGRYSKEMLDNIGDDKAITVAQSRYDEAVKNMRDLVSNSNLGKANKAALTQQLEMTIANYGDGVTNATEGAWILKYLDESGAGSGWNPNRFADVIRGKKTSPGSLLEDVSKRLGFNLPGGLGIAAPPSAQRAEAIGNMAASAVGGKAAAAGRAYSWLRGQGQPPVNTLSWQRATGAGPLPASVALKGQAALRDFYQADED